MSKKHKNKPEADEAPPAAEGVESRAEQAEPAFEQKESDSGLIEQEMAELKERLQRLSADYQNYQKRAYRQMEQARQLAKEEMVKGLLSVLDDFEHALEKGREAKDVSAVLEGVRIVYDHLLKVLGGEGVRRIEVVVGERFDPSRHEAMLHENSSGFEDNAVLRELGAGYVMNDRTLRPAKVTVVKAAAQPTEPAEQGRAEAGQAEQNKPKEAQEKEQE